MMTPEQAAAYIMAQAVSAMAAIEGMKAANRERESQGFALAYGEKAFAQVEQDYVIGHNAVLEIFVRANN